ncbi:MAG: DUF86 domain-containing protein [Thermoproteus sp.]|jgi:uncharacterized protein YutE (UPF0331/DUF86 family)|nr:DUF86 domain-containing protein [Thermoproteus sp.]MDT7882548.1 DUF86 domain-containing protein [Thermoproteus sp.]
MARIKALAEYLLKLTEFLDQEVSRGFDLNDMGQLMKFLHALQLQAQALIDMVQRAAALMGEPTQSYVEAGAALARKGVFTHEDLRLYRAVVGFRNVVVHGYTSVDVLRISQILAGREYRKLADLALRILEAAGDP